MRKLAKIILGAAVLAGAVMAATTPALAQQQTQAQPFVPYNGSNGAGPLSPNSTSAQPINSPTPAHLLGVPAFPTYTGNTAANPACDRSSAAYNPYNCR